MSAVATGDRDRQRLTPWENDCDTDDLGAVADDVDDVDDETEAEEFPEELSLAVLDSGIGE